MRTVLWTEFPANREFNREFWSFWLSFTHGAAWHAAQFTVLSLLWSTIRAQKEQGIFSRYQEIEIPCYGFEQRELVNFSMTLSRKTPRFPPHKWNSFLRAAFTKPKAGLVTSMDHALASVTAPAPSRAVPQKEIEVVQKICIRFVTDKQTEREIAGQLNGAGIL